MLQHIVHQFTVRSTKCCVFWELDESHVRGDAGAAGREMFMVGRRKHMQNKNEPSCLEQQLR